MENKTSKYLKYAIGEIVLVVIGILIALQINNWNEERKANKNLILNLEIIKDNLNSDLNDISEIILFYEHRDSIINDLVDNRYTSSFFDSINSSNYDSCEPCKSLGTSYIPLYLQTKGYELLKSYNFESNTPYGVLSQDIISFYTLRLSRMENILEKIRVNTSRNKLMLEPYPWYKNYMRGNFSKDFILYLKTDQLYKNRLITYQNLAIGNYLKEIKQYDIEAKEILAKLESIKNE